MDLEMLQRAREEAYHALLMEYASGCLDEAHALLIAAHAALSPTARLEIARYESIGGLMLEKQCAPVRMTSDALNKVLAKLDADAGQIRTASKPKQASSATPRCLQQYLCKQTWVACAPGRFTISIRTNCTRSEARLFRMEPGAILIPPEAMRAGAILILEGRGSDGINAYSRGDMIVIEPGTVHPFQADANSGAEIMLVQTRPALSEHLARRVLSLFLKR